MPQSTKPTTTETDHTVVPTDDHRMRVRQQQLDGIAGALRKHALDQLRLGTESNKEVKNDEDSQAVRAVVEAFVGHAIEGVRRNVVIEDDLSDNDDDAAAPVEPYDFALAEQLRSARAEYESLVGSVGALRRKKMESRVWEEKS